MQKVTLADIAKSLGVSKTLVSLVLNGRGDQHGINPETQERVRKKAQELNYRPNPIARGLRTGKSNTIGLIVTDISNIFMATIARAIEDKVRSVNYNLVFCSSDEDPKRESDLIEMLRGRQVDGLIFMSSAKDAKLIEQLQKEKVPFVLIDRFLPGIATNYVGTNNFEASKNAVLHLIEQDYQKIGFLSITPKHISPIVDREKGYIEALKSSQLAVDESLIRDIPFDNIKSAVYEVLNDFCLSTKPTIDALYVANNSIAIACMQYFKEYSIKVPTDLAFISFDDIELFKLSTPSISAVAQPIQGIGTKAVELLLQHMQHKGDDEFVPQHLELEGNLVIRNSSTRPLY